MENVAEQIKAYVLIISPEIEDNDFLGYVIGDVIDRVLMYTNRWQRIDTDYEDEAIPEVLFRPLASTVVSVYRNVGEVVNSSNMVVKSIEDNGQRITYGEALVSYLHNVSDTEIFGGVRELLDKFRIPTIVGYSA